jgi:hypothetical protein
MSVITQDESLAAILASATLGDTAATLKQLFATDTQLQVHQHDDFFAFVERHPAHRDALLAQVLPQHPTFDFISRALRSGMAPTTAITVDDATSLSLPCYLAHKRQLPLLLRLLREGGLSLSACGASADDLWPHLQLAEEEAPLLCQLLEHLTGASEGKTDASAETDSKADDSEASDKAEVKAATATESETTAYTPTPAFSAWLRANPALIAPLAAELAAHPLLAEAMAGCMEEVEAQVKADAEARAMAELVQRLCEQPAAEARAYLEQNTNTPQLIRVAAHHGFVDLIYSFVTRVYSSPNAPTCPVSTPYRLSADDVTNAWLWLIKGDGDLDQKAWAAMIAAGLISSSAAACAVLAGVHRAGDKVTAVPKYSDGSITSTDLLLQAVRDKNTDAVKCLIQRMVDVNIRGADSRTALHMVASGDDAEMVKVLLEAKASVASVDDYGNTPLHWASTTPIARLLVEHKADINARDHADHTPLHSSRINGKVRNGFWSEPRSASVVSYLRALNAFK